MKNLQFVAFSDYYYYHCYYYEVLLINAPFTLLLAIAPVSYAGGTQVLRRYYAGISSHLVRFGSFLLALALT